MFGFFKSIEEGGNVITTSLAQDVFTDFCFRFSLLRAAQSSKLVYPEGFPQTLQSFWLAYPNIDNSFVFTNYVLSCPVLSCPVLDPVLAAPLILVHTSYVT